MNRMKIISATILSLLLSLQPFLLKADSSTDNSIRLNSDQSKIDGKTGLFEHCGNAILTQQGLTIKAECLIGKKSKTGEYEHISAQGNPAELIQKSLKKNETLTVTAKKIEYRVSESQFTINTNAKLHVISNDVDSVSIAATTIQLDNKNVNDRNILAVGKPLTVELIKSNQTDLKAEAERLHYNTKSSKLELSNNVVANLESRKISAGVFRYNGETKVSSFEKSDDAQVEIIQTKKESK